MAKETLKNLKVFGYGLAIITAFIAGRVWMKYGLTPSVIFFIILSASLCFLTLINVWALQGFYRGWMKVAGLIGHVISMVVLASLFYCIFGLVGLILRVLRKDILDQKIDCNKKSYWVVKETAQFNKKRYQDQF